MAGNLNHPRSVIPPYPVTPPATPTPSQSNYFPQNGAPSTSPPPRPPKLPNNSSGTHPSLSQNGQPPALPPRSQQTPTSDLNQQRRPSSSRFQQHDSASSSHPALPQISQISEEHNRRRSEELNQRRPSRPATSDGHSQNSSGVPSRVEETPPPPPPKTPPKGLIHQVPNTVPPQMSQFSLPGTDGNGDTKRQRPRRESKSTKQAKPHVSEMERLRRTKNATRSRLRILSLGRRSFFPFSTINHAGFTRSEDSLTWCTLIRWRWHTWIFHFTIARSPHARYICGNTWSSTSTRRRAYQAMRSL